MQEREAGSCLDMKCVPGWSGQGTRPADRMQRPQPPGRANASPARSGPIRTVNALTRRPQRRCLRWPEPWANGAPAVYDQGISSPALSNKRQALPYPQMSVQAHPLTPGVRIFRSNLRRTLDRARVRANGTGARTERTTASARKTAQGASSGRLILSLVINSC